MTQPARNPEAGFAVLMIYSMAAIIAILLFMQLPRVAFEAQRDKEQLLIDRGQQYSRAVQLYVRKFNKFPADFDALANTQNMRFLRRKYKDPMTGKDDWRIIHVGPGGVFTDSLIHKADPNQQKKDQQTFITEIQQTGGNPVDATQNVNVATRQRPSDLPNAPGDPNNTNPNNPNPNNPNGPPQFDSNGNPIPAQPGVAGQQPGFPGQPTIPGQPPIPGQPNFGQPQFNANGTPTAPGQPFPGTTPGQFQNDPNQQNGQPGGPPGAAAGLINQLLTTPRPGGLNGLGGFQQGAQPAAQSSGFGAATPSTTGTPVPTAAGQNVVGGGIAGVASKLELKGIKVYNEQKSYNKWEFVYDITKDPARTGATSIPANGAQAPGTPIGQPQNGAASASATATGFGGGAGGLTTTTGQAPPPPPPPTPQQ